MAKLLFHRATILSVGAYPTNIRVTNLPHCRLRLINCVADTEIEYIIMGICDRNAPIDPGTTISLFHMEQMRAAGYEVGWEGDIELQSDQIVFASYELTPGVAGPTAGVNCFVTVGYEPL